MASPNAPFSILEATSARLAIITRSLDCTAVAVEANSAQVASLSVSITQLKTAKMQAQHVERRIGVAATLLPREA
ncbi:hypothetical protein GFS31_41650 (plasmid) [Leptolyngbya sp. BL0902]|uniref:hypothetical protein n=1 Tax=Leptolyngbya sp. BL0902 TaxID=1115757 RepID=UPI0018E83B43|nr:hypothetical protein [Leptolyngbya sp. BL0902]QQE67452.1 hypothetical protein GFS31_41650 [Leptolyngbya sp. BL0902]